MQAEKLKNNETRKYVAAFYGLLPKSEIAKELGITPQLLCMIVKGERSDHYGVLEFCKKAIEEKLQAIMPN